MPQNLDFIYKMSILKCSKGTLIEMKSALEDLGISIGDIFSPAVRTAAEGIKSISKGLSCLVQEFPLLSKGIAYVVGGLLVSTVATRVFGYAMAMAKGVLLTAKGVMLLFAGAQTAATVAQTAGTAAANAGTLASLRMALASRAQAAGALLMAGASKAHAGGMGIMQFATSGVTLGIRAMGVAFATNPVGLALTAIVVVATTLLTVFDGLRAKFLGFVNTVLDAMGPVGRAIRTVAGFFGIGNEEAPEIMALSASEISPEARQTPLGMAADLPEPASDYASLVGSGAGAGVSIKVDMPISVDMGVDGPAFEAKLRSYKPEIENFVRSLMERAMNEAERRKGRLEYAW
jgi:hypothetical protein